MIIAIASGKGGTGKTTVALNPAVDMVRELGIPFGVVVNRAGIGDGWTHAFCRDQGIPILLVRGTPRKTERHACGLWRMSHADL